MMKKVDRLISGIWEEKEEEMLDTANAMCRAMELPECGSLEDIFWMLATRSEWYLQEGRNLAKLRRAIAAMMPRKRRPKLTVH
jgi:hypothetical protein